MCVCHKQNAKVKTLNSNDTVNEHMELAEWLVHWAPKLASRVRCSTRSSP